MSVTTKSPQNQQEGGLRRIWKSPTASTRWFWLAGSLLLYIGILIWYIYTLKTQPSPEPIEDPLRLFGIIAFVLVLSSAAYSLRRRFVHGLPGRVQSWLWMHTWVGIVTILIALLHENFAHVTRHFCTTLHCWTDTYLATSALYALIVLVVVGVVGRVLDMVYTRVIAQDAASNGVGIARAVEERILELEYTVERLCAGKSEAFNQYCMNMLASRRAIEPDERDFPALQRREYSDFQRACDTLGQHGSLMLSLQHQQRARAVMRFWRILHIVIASLSLLIISYHAIMELLANVFHFITPA